MKNPSRVMRLPGSVAWPLKAGRTLEATGWLDWPTRAAPYSLDELKSCAGRLGYAEPKVDLGGESLFFLDLNDAPRQRPTMSQRLFDASKPECWHHNVLRLVGQLLRSGTPADVIQLLLPANVVQPGYTMAQTEAQIAEMIAGGLRKGFYRTTEGEH